MFRSRLRWVVAPAVMALIGLFVSLIAMPVAALEIRRGDVVTIGSDEVVGNTAILARSAVVDGTVNGDLLVASTEARINGTVNGRVFWAGEQLTLGGAVGDSVYAAGLGFSATPSASVGRDLAMLGANLSVEPGSSIGQDVVMGGNQAIVRGRVRRTIRFTGLALEVTGPVGEALAPGTPEAAESSSPGA
ncbi:MAG: hypothetical protein QME94_18340, partial [Anaerolineae bacterium]|nr:hypothetical protein [Anaerolineae bacterium]